MIRADACVPEPATMSLAIIGAVAGLVLYRRKKVDWSSFGQGAIC